MHNEVLEPFTITLPVTILEYDLMKSSRAAAGIELIGDEVIRPKALTLQFAVLEPGDGGTIRIIYDGPVNTPIEFRGACLDAPKPIVLPSTNMYFTTRSERRVVFLKPLLFLPAWALLMGSLALIAFVGEWLLKRFLGTHRAEIVETYLKMSGLGILGLLLLLVMFFGTWEGYKRLRDKYVPPEIKP